MVKKLSTTIDEIKALIKEAKQYDSTPQRNLEFTAEFFEYLTGSEATMDDYLYREFLRTIWRELEDKKERSRERNMPFTLTIVQKPIRPKGAV